MKGREGGGRLCRPARQARFCGFEQPGFLRAGADLSWLHLPAGEKEGEEEWSGRPDSNRRRTAWEAAILPLNYSREGKEQFIGPSRLYLNLNLTLNLNFFRYSDGGETIEDDEEARSKRQTLVFGRRDR